MMMINEMMYVNKKPKWDCRKRVEQINERKLSINQADRVEELFVISFFLSSSLFFVLRAPVTYAVIVCRARSH